MVFPSLMPFAVVYLGLAYLGTLERNAPGLLGGVTVKKSMLRERER